MRKQATAEFFLTWFTSRHDASTIVGDLTETGSLRWHEISRVSLSLMWMHFTRAPLGNTRALAAGAVLSYAALAVIAPLLMGLMGWNGAATDQRFVIWLVAAVLWGRILAPFLIGYLMVRVTPDRAMTACVLWAALSEVILLTYWGHAASQGHPSPMGRDFYLLNLLPFVLMLTGGAVFRKRSALA